MDADELLGPNGLVAQAFEGYEHRPQQLEMARKVQQTMRQGGVLAAEAGTGVGKSYAYLTGAIDQAVRKQGRIVISTYTIHLQQQLIEKDIPFLRQIVPHEFRAVLAKGRNNYICLRRLDYARKRQLHLFEDSGLELERLVQWARQTQDGSLSELGFLPSHTVWQSVRSEHGSCRGRKCRHFRECFYWKNRRQLDTADLIVANHALLFSDLVLKQAGAGVLPDYSQVILDEAHTLEHVAEDHFGINLSRASISFFLNALHHPRRRRGLLMAGTQYAPAREQVEACREAMHLFYTQVRTWLKHTGRENGTACDPDFVTDTLSGPLRQLRLELNKLWKKNEEEDEQFELQRMMDRCRTIEKELKRFLSQEDDDAVYWIETGPEDQHKIIFRSAPIHVGPYIKRCLFESCKSVILTSATLGCGQDNPNENFTFFADRIGLEDYQALQAGSPFDYSRQVTLYVETELPEPNNAQFVNQAVKAVQQYLKLTQGRAFVLFTSYAMLRDMAQTIQSWLESEGMQGLIQGEDMDRASMLDYFKRHPRCVLFGTDSFWQGVDVPGRQLSNVIIVRLPFAVPNHPLIRGRIEKLRQEGRNPFYEYQLPMAILKFKQGFGRLIRNKTDSGIVVVLDSRIIHKAYGKYFLDAIPQCRLVFSGSEPMDL